MSEARLTRAWARAGVAGGFLACASYPALIALSMPLQLTIAIAAIFAMGLAAGTLGLYHVLSLRRRTASLQMGVVLNIIASAVVLAMFVVQLSVRTAMSDVLASSDTQAMGDTYTPVWTVIDHVQLGLDVVWDIFISVGTVLIAANMYGHPRFG